MINILFKKYTATENEQREIKKQKKTLVKLKAMMTMSVTYPMLHNLQASSKYYVISFLSHKNPMRKIRALLILRYY